MHCLHLGRACPLREQQFAINKICLTTTKLKKNFLIKCWRYILNVFHLSVIGQFLSTYIFKRAIPASFHTIFKTARSEKMSIQHMVLGFAPTTFRTRVSSCKH